MLFRQLANWVRWWRRWFSNFWRIRSSKIVSVKKEMHFNGNARLHKPGLPEACSCCTSFPYSREGFINHSALCPNVHVTCFKCIINTKWIRSYRIQLLRVVNVYKIGGHNEDRFWATNGGLILMIIEISVNLSVSIPWSSWTFAWWWNNRNQYCTNQLIGLLTSFSGKRPKWQCRGGLLRRQWER